MGKSTTITHFSKERTWMIQKPRLVMQHCQPLMPTSQFQGILKFQLRKMWISIFQKMLISQFKKIFIQNFKKLILVCWSRILDCINKYGIIMLINVMKSNELTITIVFSNPHCLHTKNPDQNIIIVAFKSLGFSWKNFGWYIGPHSCKILTTSLPVRDYNVTENQRALANTWASSLLGIVSNAVMLSPASARTWTLLQRNSFKVSSVIASPYIIPTVSIRNKEKRHDHWIVNLDKNFKLKRITICQTLIYKHVRQK